MWHLAWANIRLCHTVDFGCIFKNAPNSQNEKKAKLGQEKVENENYWRELCKQKDRMYFVKQYSERTIHSEA